MASFMAKKKKYTFQIEITLEELLEVPFVSAVLFAKLRLLDSGSFQDHSTREEVKDHKVKWNSKFTFQCKMLASASTGVMEKCILRISVRKESKGGRSFNKLGFVDVNLAEYAGAGIIHRKALLQGYDARHRQDNSMIRFSIQMNMLSGDILFKVPSPKQKTPEEPTESSRTDELSTGSVSGSAGNKKRPALLNSDLLLGSESVVPGNESCDNPSTVENKDFPVERNPSSTALSKNSYSSINSHSRHSSAESGHLRNPSSSSVSENGSLDRIKGYERRKKVQLTDDAVPVSGRVEITRVDADEFVDDLMKNIHLDDDSAETSGLQLFIAKDGSAALGNHEVKSEMSTGVKVFKHVVMDDR